MKWVVLLVVLLALGGCSTQATLFVKNDSGRPMTVVVKWSSHGSVQRSIETIQTGQRKIVFKFFGSAPETVSFECGQKVFSYAKDKLPAWLQNVDSEGKKINWVFDGERGKFESGGLSSSEEIGRIIIGTIAVILLLAFAIFYALLRRNERDFRQAKTNASMPK